MNQPGSTERVSVLVASAADIGDPGSVKELQPFPKYPILVPGAGSGLGFALSRHLANQGYHVLAGSRSETNIQTLRSAVENEGGFLPEPFIADITNPFAVADALIKSGLYHGEPIHYMPIAAGGLETVLRNAGSLIVQLRKADRHGSLTKEMLESATEEIRKLTTTDSAMDAAMAINYSAPLTLFDVLVANGNIGQNSVVLNTSSSISDGCDPDHLEAFQGPWFYYTVGFSKEKGVREQRKRALEAGARHLNVVAPEIADTKVGKFIEGLIKLITAADPKVAVSPEHVLTTQVVEAIYNELLREPTSDRARTVYVSSNGTSLERPIGWDKPFVPYF